MLGVGSNRTTIRASDQTLLVEHGWMFRIETPLKNVESVRKVSARPWAWGVHPGGDSWVVNGSRDGIVEVKFTHPVATKSVRALSSGAVRTLYLSLTDPDGFVAALTPRG